MQNKDIFTIGIMSMRGYDYYNWIKKWALLIHFRIIGKYDKSLHYIKYKLNININILNITLNKNIKYPSCQNMSY